MRVCHFWLINSLSTIWLLLTQSNVCAPHPERQASEPARADISADDGHSLWRRAVGLSQPASLSGCLRGNALAFLPNKVLVKYTFFSPLSNLAHRSKSEGPILLPGTFRQAFTVSGWWCAPLLLPDSQCWVNGPPGVYGLALHTAHNAASAGSSVAVGVAVFGAS